MTDKSTEREKIGVTLKSRLSFFYDEDIKQKKYSVSPQQYTLIHNQVKNLRFNNITFGKGNRQADLNCKFM